MNIRLTTSEGTRSCTLTADKKTKCEIEVQTDYDSETIAYAVCHFFRHAPTVADPLIHTAVSLALSFRKTRPICCVYHISARLLSLPGKEATVKLTLTKGEIRIISVILC